MEPAVPGALVEYDDKGVPYYKWPPFPNPPHGVNIIPFKDFKPSGIQVVMDDEVELDGENIPTVQLLVTHDGEARPKKKRKTQRTAAGEVVKRKPWWEDWAEGEDLRSNFKYDKKLHMTDRLTSVAADFRKQRTWPPRMTGERSLEELWDMFQVFTGIIGGGTRQFNACDDDDDSVSDVESYDGVQRGAEGGEIASQAAQPVAIQAFDLSQHDIVKYKDTAEPTEEEKARELQTKESRMERFLENPMRSMKIFFSSYFRVRGMLWDKVAIRDCPRVVLFFLNFIIRNQALPELKDKLPQAIAIVEKAKEELPQTQVIGSAVPDELSNCFKALYGSQIPNPWRDLNSGLEKLSEENKVLDMSGSDALQPPGLPAEESACSPDKSNLDVWGSGDHGDSIGDAWGSTSDALDTASADNLGEGAGQAADTAMDNPWAQPASMAVWTVPEYFLMTLMGPTTLPLSHKVGYVERSTRYIKSVTMPADSRKTVDLSMFAKVVLSSHKKFFGSNRKANYRAAIQAPELLEDPYSEKAADSVDVNLPRHDPRVDDIVLYLLPKAAETLIVNMNLGGTFVQVVPDRSWQMHTHVGEEGLTPEKRQTDEIFWYCEQITQILPSFWYEMQAEPKPYVKVAEKGRTVSETPA